MVQPPEGNKAVDVGQGGGAVEEGHVVVLHRGLLDEEEELAVAQGEQAGLLLHGEHRLSKSMVPVTRRASCRTSSR